MDKKQWSENSGFFSTGTQVFLVMAECGNLSEASSVLDMHPSTISYHLSELEKSLNLPLFDHSKRPLKLTSEGLNLYNELKYHFSSLNVRVQKLRQKNFLKPIIRIGIIESLSRNLGVHLIEKLSPLSNEISLLTGTSERLIELVKTQTVDIAIACTKKIDESFFAQKYLFSEPSVLALPKEPRFEKDFFTWEELRFCGLPFLRYNRFSGGSEMTENFLNSLFIHLPNRIEVDDGGVMLKLISKGIGWSLVRPATLVQYPDLAARVHFCKMPDPVMQREVILIFGKSVNPELVDTVETLSKSFYEAELSKEFKKILQQK